MLGKVFLELFERSLVSIIKLWTPKVSKWISHVNGYGLDTKRTAI